MNHSEIESKIASYSKDTGIPRKELRRMCLRAGINLLERGEMKITPADPSTASKPKPGEAA